MSLEALPYERSAPSAMAIWVTLFAKGSLFFVVNLAIVLVIIVGLRGARAVGWCLGGERGADGEVSSTREREGSGGKESQLTSALP